jgi:hypothetical protein
MAYVHVDRLVLDRLRTSGFADAQTALLLDRVSRTKDDRPATARRIVELALGSGISIGLVPQLAYVFAQSPVVPEEIRRNVAGVATLDIGGHLGWRAGEILDPRGIIPKTIVEAAPGRRLGDVVQHPSLDPDAVILPSELRSEHAALIVPLDVVTLRTPIFPIGRVGLWRRLVSHRRREKDTGAQAPLKTFAFCSLLGVLGFANSLQKYATVDHSTMMLVSTLIMAFSTMTVFVIMLDFVLGHAIVEMPKRRPSSYEVHARIVHRDALRKAARERGFDDDGAPVR